MSPVNLCPRTTPEGKNFHEEQPEQETTYVGEPGYPFTLRESDLHEKPYGEKQHRGHVDGRNENKNEYERFYFSPREQQKVRPKDTRDGSACPYHGDGRRWVKRELGCGGSEPGKQIEHDEPPMADRILHVVAEDPQIEHISGHVQDTPVKKHGGEDGEAVVWK